MVEEPKKKIEKKAAPKKAAPAKAKASAKAKAPAKAPAVTKAPAKKAAEAKAPADKKTVAKKKAAASTAVAEVNRGKRKTRTGIVVSDKMDSTIVVGVQALFKHPLYRKTMKRTTKFVAHDAEGQAGIGDTVVIMESRPLSKMKRWRLVKIVSKAR